MLTSEIYRMYKEYVQLNNELRIPTKNMEAFCKEQQWKIVILSYEDYEDLCKRAGEK